MQAESCHDQAISSRIVGDVVIAKRERERSNHWDPVMLNRDQGMFSMVRIESMAALARILINITSFSIKLPYCR